MTEDVAADRYLALATEPLEPAGYYFEGTLRPPPKQLADANFIESVWELVATQTHAGRAAA